MALFLVACDASVKQGQNLSIDKDKGNKVLEIAVVNVNVPMSELTLMSSGVAWLSVSSPIGLVHDAQPPRLN